MNKSGSYLLLIPVSLGITTLATQIIILREFLSLYNGNELVLGLVLANWMLLTAAGAWIGRKTRQRANSEQAILIKLLLLAITGPLILLLANYLRRMLFPPGSLIGITKIFAFTFLLLSPFCILSGYLFSRISGLLHHLWDKQTVAKVYAWESAGSVLGALLANFILVFILPPFPGLLSIILLTAWITGFISYRRKLSLTFRVIILVTAGFTGILLLIRPGNLSNKWMYPGQKIESYRNTPYGSLMVTSMEGQLNFYSNHSLLFSSNNIIQNEESVHYAMLQRPAAQNVLVVEGGISGALNEILKYPVNQVHYVEMNPWIAKLGQEYCKELNDKRVTLIQGDVRQYLKKSGITYDIVLLLVPEPSTILVNRFYTLEFFRILRSRMQSGAVLSLGLVPTPNYLGAESAKLQSVMFSTLKQVFPLVALLPGDKNYYLASGKPLDTRIAGKAAQLGISTEYANEYFLDDQVISDRSDKILKELNPRAELNTDFKPVAFFDQINYWLSQYPGAENIFFLFFMLMVQSWIIFSKPVQTGMMVTGLSASSLQMLLLFSFQVMYGNLFLMIGAFIMVFMTGLYLGSIYAGKWDLISISKKIPQLQMIMSLTGLLVLGFMVLLRLDSMASPMAYAGFLLLDLLIAVLAGIQYSCFAGTGQKEAAHISGSLYSSDMLGSAAGTLLVTIILIPFLGIINATLTIVVINALTAGWLLIKRNTLLL